MPIFYHVLCNVIGWYRSDQLRYSLNIYQFDCFYVFWSRTAERRALNPLLVLFSFLTSRKITKILMKKLWKSPHQVFPRRLGALTRRMGDLMKNLENPGKTGRVGRYADAPTTELLRTLEMRRSFVGWHNTYQDLDYLGYHKNLI